MGKAAQKIGLVFASRLLGAVVVAAVGVLAMVVARNMDSIAEQAVRTRDLTLPDILESQRTMLNVERLLRFGETVRNSDDPDVRREAVNLAQALAQAMAFEKDPRTSQAVWAAFMDIKAISDLQDRLDGHRQEIQASLAEVFRQEERRASSPWARSGAGAGDAACANLGHHAALELMQAEDEDPESLRERIEALEVGLSSCRPSATGASSREEVRRILGMLRQIVEIRVQAAVLWKDVSSRIEELSRTLSRDAARLTAESFTSIAGQARRFMLTVTAGLAGLALVAVAVVYFTRRHILTPVLRAARGLEEVELQGREAQLPRAFIREFDALGRAVERLGALLGQNAQRRRELEDEVAERQAVEEQLASLNRRLEDLVAARTRDLEAKAGELEAANRRLRDLDEMKSAFLSSVSHEMRTPLTSIFGFVKLVAKDFDRHFAPLVRDREPLERKARNIHENLEVVIEEGGRLTRLINNVLDLARIESGRMPWNDCRVDLPSCLHRAAEGLASRFAPFTGARLRLDLPAGLPEVYADPDRLVQVFINLLDNAVKFTPQGEVAVTASPVSREWVRVTVQDTGVGIPAQDLEAIFSRFHQAGNADSLTGKPVGAGLGLAICKEIVDHYRGRIWAESEPGQGSRITVELPAVQE